LSFETIAARLRTAGVTSRELAEMLDRSLEAEDPVRVSRVLATMFWFPSLEAVPRLCSMLVGGVGWHLPEDVAELLGEAGDPSAVEALVHVLDHPPADDFDGFLGEKVVAALAKFSDQRAVEAIERAAGSSQPRVWQATIPHAIATRSPKLLISLGRRVANEDPEASFANELLDCLAVLGTPEAREVIALAARSADQHLAGYAATLQERGEQERPR
jgi:HEAT repeat protein